MKTKISPIIIITLVCCFLTNINIVQNVGGATGDIEVGTTTYVIGQPSVIYLDDLTANTPFGLTFTTGCATNFNFSTGIGQTGMSFTLELSAPSSGDTCTITLYYFYTAFGGHYNDSTVMDSVVLSATDYDSVFPDELIIGLAITVLVISILVSIAVGMRIRDR